MKETWVPRADTISPSTNHMDLTPSIPHHNATPRATLRRYPGGPTVSETSEDSEAAVEAVEGESSGGTSSHRRIHLGGNRVSLEVQVSTIKF